MAAPSRKASLTNTTRKRKKEQAKKQQKLRRDIQTLEDATSNANATLASLSTNSGLRHTSVDDIDRVVKLVTKQLVDSNIENLTYDRLLSQSTDGSESESERLGARGTRAVVEARKVINLLDSQLALIRALGDDSLPAKALQVIVAKYPDAPSYAKSQVLTRYVTQVGPCDFDAIAATALMTDDAINISILDPTQVDNFARRTYIKALKGAVRNEATELSQAAEFALKVAENLAASSFAPELCASLIDAGALFVRRNRCSQTCKFSFFLYCYSFNAVT